MFQKSVLDRYIVAQKESEKLKLAWHCYGEFFLKDSRQKEIRKLKEEEYQDGFLNNLFVDVLGYTLRPNDNFNLVREKKNQANNKKADAAILRDGDVVGVIELKNTSTKTLDSIQSQAFSYKNNHKNCQYVIVSNFEKLRLYIDHAVEYYEFNLFELTECEFNILYLLLHKDNILNGQTRRIKTDSLAREKLITEQLYQDYATFKTALFHNLVKLNSPKYDHVLLYKKSQKLLDRFLFLFFAEDRSLVPFNFVRLINEEWRQLDRARVSVSLYERYKIYFEDLNLGNKHVSLPILDPNSTEESYELFAYNGGLFAPDEVLDSLIIDNELLYDNTLKLSEYDFGSEVDVNILGHIFENSLDDIDNMHEKLNQDRNKVEDKKSKRKQDGVFYTPKYITQYMVLQTIGQYCIQYKLELGINEADYYSGRQKSTQKRLFEQLEEYRHWLLNLKICDPACGSGAFLNQALEFLILEHQSIDQLANNLMGTTLKLSNVDQDILENNLYGVDLNDESVEIARLSLWLRTARPHRKLNTLSHRIKSGNSLIKDSTIAGSKAFDWEHEFPEVFKNGGFDIIIGNPPYGVDFDLKTKDYLNKFDPLVPDYEIYIYFISLFKSLLKPNGHLSYIFPNTFLSTVFGEKYRSNLLESVNVLEFVDLSFDNTFIDASVRTIIMHFENKKPNSSHKTKLTKVNDKKFIILNDVSQEVLFQNASNLASFFSQTEPEKNLVAKVMKYLPLCKYYTVSQGLIPYDKYRGHDEATIKGRVFHSNKQENPSFKKELKGGDVDRYFVNWNGQLWIKYGEWLAAPRSPKFFIGPRILVREITSDRLQCCYVEDEFYNTPSIINIIDELNSVPLKYILAILNSKLLGWYHNKTSPKANKGLFPKILVNDVRNLPLKIGTSAEQIRLIGMVDEIILLKKEVQENLAVVTNLLKSKYPNININKKLSFWHDVSFSDFIKELKKQKITLTLQEQSEWMTWMNMNVEKIKGIEAKILTLDDQIDQMVFDLYNLTEIEIELINSNN